MTNIVNENEKQPSPLILIVDDVEDNHKFVGSILRKKGCKIASALSALQALDILKEIHPDLILLDIMMPGIDGFEFCKRVKKIPGKSEIPIIFLSAKADTGDILEGFALGAVDYITKPFKSSELLVRIKTHLNLKHALETQKKLTAELQEALSKVKLLTGMLPICSKCKKIRDDKGYWKQVEEYVAEHSEAHFSHSLCPGCIVELYPDLADKVSATSLRPS
ncbi:MAG: response regulator [bacterium]|nr:response regulator [bacterium]